MLARRLTGILPPPTRDEMLEVPTIWSVAGRPAGARRRARHDPPPPGAHHHTISVSGLIVGGSPPHPGEVTLAHRGVLFCLALNGLILGAVVRAASRSGRSLDFRITKLYSAAMRRRRPPLARRPADSGLVAFRAPAELARLLEVLPNKSEFIRSAIEAQLDEVCATCRGSGRVRRVTEQAAAGTSPR